MKRDCWGCWFAGLLVCWFAGLLVSTSFRLFPLFPFFRFFPFFSFNKMAECMVCIEKFNKSTRKPVTCPYCATSICRTCIQTCLLQDNSPKCQMPECKKAWSDDFLATSLTKVWIDGDYRAHREKILVDQEKARLPETQEHAAVYINAKAIVDEIQPRVDALQAQLMELPLTKQRNALFKVAYDYKLTRLERDAAKHDYDQLEDAAKKEARPLRKQLKALKSDAYKVAKRHVEAFGRPLTDAPVRPVEEKKWTFVGKCPKSECMGFVGMDYACGLCKMEVCKDCMEPKLDEHTCNTDNILNVKALRKEAKPCPKCAAQISKIDGCDQMWCTQCHTAFSWRTGAEETLVHNPHFYEWMRRTGQQMAPGAVQLGGGAAGAAGGAGCGFRGMWNTFQTSIRTAYPPTFAMKEKNRVEKLNKISQDTGHVNGWCLGTLNGQVRAEQRTDEEAKRVLRVRRLAKELTDAEWMKPLERLERGSKRRNALRDIYDMYIQAAMTVMDQFNLAVTNLEKTKWERRSMSVNDAVQFELDAANAATDSAIKQYTELANYVNEELRKIKNRYSTTVYKISNLDTA